MDMYEIIEVSIYKKESNKTTWEISNGNEVKYMEVEVGKGDMMKATLQAMNKLGKEGWSLCSYPNHFYVFHMQRKIE